MRGVENLVGVFDTEQARIIGVAAKGTTDVSYFAAQDTPTVGVPVTAVTDPVTGGIGILGPSGEQVAGNAAPQAFTTRALAQTDNGMTLICATAQTATVDAGLPVGFGLAFKGAVSFTAGAGVTISDVRTTGAVNPWCALVQIAADAYDVVGTKA